MICGTSVTAVMRWRRMVLPMAFGVRVCRKTSVEPDTRPISNGTDWPYMCDRGMMPRPRSGPPPMPVWAMARAVWIDLAVGQDDAFRIGRGAAGEEHLGDGGRPDVPRERLRACCGLSRDAAPHGRGHRRPQ